jgi:hypothetical protein
MKPLALALLLLSLAGPATARPAPVMPAPFRGEWASDRASCGNDASDSRLHITAREVMFYESGGPVRAVQRLDARTVRVRLLATDDMGERGAASYTFRLSADGRRLTNLTDGSGVPRIRCPG